MSSNYDVIGQDEAGNEQWRGILLSENKTAEERFLNNKNRWNRWFYFGQYGSVGFPALAALVLKLETIPEGVWKRDIAAVFAALGAIIASGLSVGRVRNRWIVSRQARTSIQSLKIEILNPNADLSVVANRLKETMEEYERGVTDDD